MHALLRMSTLFGGLLWLSILWKAWTSTLDQRHAPIQSGIVEFYYSLHELPIALNKSPHFFPFLFWVFPPPSSPFLSLKCDNFISHMICFGFFMYDGVGWALHICHDSFWKQLHFYINIIKKHFTKWECFSEGSFTVQEAAVATPFQSSKTPTSLTHMLLLTQKPQGSRGSVLWQHRFRHVGGISLWQKLHYSHSAAVAALLAIAPASEIWRWLQ